MTLRGDLLGTCSPLAALGVTCGPIESAPTLLEERPNGWRRFAKRIGNHWATWWQKDGNPMPLIMTGEGSP